MVMKFLANEMAIEESRGEEGILYETRAGEEGFNFVPRLASPPMS
jgi:hypothetical protein